MGQFIGTNVEKSFVIKGPKLWARLPDCVKNSINLKSFNSRMKKWYKDGKY